MRVANWNTCVDEVFWMIPEENFLRIADVPVTQDSGEKLFPNPCDGTGDKTSLIEQLRIPDSE